MADLRDALGETRYRVALLKYGRRLTQVQIGRRLGMTQPAVSYHLAKIEREFRPAAGGGRHRMTSLSEQEERVAALVAAYALN